MRPRIPPSALVLAIGGSLTVVELLLPDGPARQALFVVVALGCALTVALAARYHRPPGLFGWYLVAAAQVVWVIGVGSSLAMTGLAPGLYQVAAYLLAAVGVEILTRSRTTVHDWRRALDSMIVTVAVTMVWWVFLIGPALGVGRGSDHLVEVGQLVAALALVAALVRFAYAPGGARLTRVALLFGLGGLLAYQSVVRVSAGPGPTFPDSTAAPSDAWLFALIAAAAITTHPRMHRLSDPAPAQRDPGSVLQLLALGAALVVGPASFASQILRGDRSAIWLAPVFYLSLVLLVLARTLAMIREANAQATSDDLTGLPNRRALHRTARTRLTDPGERQALLLLDLDRFKEVNDSLGHHSGDELLVQVAGRLRAGLRPQDTLARLGGDEFAILLDAAGVLEAESIALSLGAALSEPFDLGVLSVHSAASIGIALFPEHGTDLSTLLRKADTAMYRAKADGGYRVHGGGDEPSGLLRLTEELHTALAEDQLVLHYQPKVDLATGSVRGVEALVRWQHPTRGLLAPDAFLERVEASGLMAAMTRVVLTKALDQVAAWREEGRPMPVAVNLSASSLVDIELPAQIAGLLAERGLPPSSLHLEITEDFLMADRARARTILTALRGTGITISVDDFGTGYSSLAYLRDLPIDELKLDRSFVMPMSQDARAAALVSSTIHLAHSLGLRMVAEGVEDAAAYAELARLGCDQAQGYHLTRPLPSAELDPWFASRAAADPASPV